MKILIASALAAVLGVAAPAAADTAESSNFSLTYAVDLDRQGNITSLRAMSLHRSASALVL